MKQKKFELVYLFHYEKLKRFKLVYLKKEKAKHKSFK